MTVDLLYIDVRIYLSSAVLIVLLLVRLPRLQRFAMWAYALAAIAGFAAIFNFGLQFHQYSSGFLNRWEMYHYQLGSKYFPELGFDGLYSASLLAQRETAPAVPMGPIRDLETNKIVLVNDYFSKIKEVRARFSEQRWTSFRRDHHNYLASTPQDFMLKVRRDHGYNPTPAWTFVAQLFGSRMGSSVTELGFLASLDIILMVVMFVFVFRTFGYQAGCLSLAIVGLGFGWRFMYIGALLRLDWLAALVIGICMLKRKYFVIAGACIGYSAVVRVFPVLFLAGPALLAVKALLAGERPQWPFRLFGGVAAVLLLGFLAGGMTGRGLHAWTEFADNIQMHRGTWGTNLVGLDTMFVGGPSFLSESLRAPVELRTPDELQDILDDHQIGRAIASGSMLLLFGFAAWHASVAEATILGVAAVFAITPAASYYWIMIAVVPLRRGSWAPLAQLLLAISMYIVARTYSPMVSHIWVYSIFSWGMALVLCAWLLPAVLQAWRRQISAVQGNP